MSKSEFQVQQINTMLKHLLLAYKHCNLYSNLKDMIYDKEHEEVIVSYYGYMRSDHTRKVYHVIVNVSCDSYAAMIHDIEDRLYHFFEGRQTAFRTANDV